MASTRLHNSLSILHLNHNIGNKLLAQTNWFVTYLYPCKSKVASGSTQKLLCRVYHWAKCDIPHFQNNIAPFYVKQRRNNYIPFTVDGRESKTSCLIMRLFIITDCEHEWGFIHQIMGNKATFSSWGYTIYAKCNITLYARQFHSNTIKTKSAFVAGYFNLRYFRFYTMHYFVVFLTRAHKLDYLVLWPTLSYIKIKIYISYND